MSGDHEIQRFVTSEISWSLVLKIVKTPRAQSSKEPFELAPGNKPEVI
jgi:hypothetical protein